MARLATHVVQRGCLEGSQPCDTPPPSLMMSMPLHNQCYVLSTSHVCHRTGAVTATAGPCRWGLHSGNLRLRAGVACNTQPSGAFEHAHTRSSGQKAGALCSAGGGAQLQEGRLRRACIWGQPRCSNGAVLAAQNAPIGRDGGLGACPFQYNYVHNYT